MPLRNNRSCNNVRWTLERSVDIFRCFWKRHCTVKEVVLSIVKLADTLTVCFPLYANGVETHLRIRVLINGEANKRAAMVVSQTTKQADKADLRGIVCEVRLKAPSIHFIWIYGQVASSHLTGSDNLLNNQTRLLRSHYIQSFSHRILNKDFCLHRKKMTRNWSVIGGIAAAIAAGVYVLWGPVTERRKKKRGKTLDGKLVQFIVMALVVEVMCRDFSF